MLKETLKASHLGQLWNRIVMLQGVMDKHKKQVYHMRIQALP